MSSNFAQDLGPKLQIHSCSLQLVGRHTKVAIDGCGHVGSRTAPEHGVVGILVQKGFVLDPVRQEGSNEALLAVSVLVMTMALARV